MNLYIRFFLLLLKIGFIKQDTLLADAKTSYRVMPWDCDINWHLTNSRYLSFMDLGRTYLLGQTKLFRPVLKRGWLPVLAASELSFIRPIKPLQKFDLVSRLLTWDEKYFYIEQRFEVNGKIHMLGLMKGLFITREGKKVDLNALMQLTGETISAPPMSPILEQWKELSNIKRSLAS